MNRSLFWPGCALFILFLTSCQNAGDSSSSGPFPQSSYSSLIQLSLNAMPGVHMDPVKLALGKQKHERCELEEASESGGLVMETVSGNSCPIRVEYVLFGNKFEFDTGIGRYNENILYLRRESPEQKREGLEIHSQFEFHIDMKSEDMIPHRVVVMSKAKHLQIGEVAIAGEITFKSKAKKESERMLDFVISSKKNSSRIQIDFGAGVMKVDGNEVSKDSAAEIFKFTAEPDLNIPFTGS